MISFKLHERGKELVLGACDADLIGKTLRSSNGAKVFINPKFYKGEIISAEELLILLKTATIVNLFGEETIAAVKSLNLKTIMVGGVPHSQIFKIL